MIAGFTSVGLFVAVASVSSGALLRSITGFGASLVATVGLSAVLDPADAVPVVVLLDLLIGLAMLPATRRNARTDRVAPALIGITLTTPIGVYALASVPAQPMRIVIGVVVAVSAVLLALQSAPTRRPTRRLLGVAGGIGGVLNGAASAGGTPLILAHYGTEAVQIERRATLSMTFVGMDLVTIVVLSIAGLIDREVFAHFAVLAPVATGVPLLATSRATHLGERSTRSVALGALFTTGMAGIARALT